MNIAKTVENIPTLIELKRIASAYVIDFRNLSEKGLRSALIKTAPQYYFDENVQQTLDNCLLHNDRDIRTLTPIFLKHILLQKDDFICAKNTVNDEIVKWEQAIIDRSNEDLIQQGGEKGKYLELFQFVLEEAWEREGEITPNEKNLIEKIRKRFKITEVEYRIIEAKLGRFPKGENQLHTHDEIERVRRFLQSSGILFSIRDQDRTSFDVIPSEVADTIRKILGVEIRNYGYTELLKHKHVKSKAYLLEVLRKCNIEIEAAPTLKGLQLKVLAQVSPSILLGGLSPRDGLNIRNLKDWCSQLEIKSSGTKHELIERLIGFYDRLLTKYEAITDEREIWYQHYEQFARRNLQFLREQQLISKDIEVERKFEDATNFLFEKKLKHKPLKLVGTAHADGAVSHQDKLIYWDNKSKEMEVDLKDHLSQFDRYIVGSDRRVAVFLVIGPGFTDESSLLAMQYFVEKGTAISLISAEDLKSLAQEWSGREGGKSDSPFPLGYLVQPGKFNRNLVPKIK